MRFSTKVAPVANPMEQPAAQGKSASVPGFSPGLSSHDRIRSYRQGKKSPVQVAHVAAAAVSRTDPALQVPDDVRGEAPARPAPNFG